MFDQVLENTILLFVAVDPIALVPIFASLTQGLNKKDVKRIYIQATIVSFFILALFYLFGTSVLDLMGISMSSFKIIGGLFLIAIAFQMVLEQRQSRRQHTAEVALDDESIQSIAIFPLAIPLIAGPGAMTTALLIAESNSSDPTQILINFLPILIIIILVAFAMWLSASLSAKVGPTIIIVVQKIFGILLGALAIEFVVAGVIESFKL
ncbi:MarC family protein [Gammaproteobacteria bacterium]|jgi:multiple antibiotic resistance protein|nr:MarC family protein [Gammaproteobacteria bacterium]MDA8799232.1 MarC family protein [Gammaproteobacteria bacterium]MDC0512229.1 MarC family protein [Gammaproteobacteria bacterium]MDC0919478.1 MarC family protein [Gammaproteobacteria bacterium]MDC1042923.1 MarC family protein [Gammaproteobacteria bacterium]